MNVLLEDIQSKFEIVLEAVNSSRDYLDRKFEARFVAIEERLSNLEFAVRQNSKDILALREDVNHLRKDVDLLRTDVDLLRKDFDHLRKDFDHLRKDFDQRQELQRIAALERRVDALEKQRSA